MPRVTKGEIQAAKNELAAIHELATESGNWNPGSAQYHAPSANRYLETLHRAGEPMPEWAVKNHRFLEAQGWRFPYGTIPRESGRRRWA